MILLILGAGSYSVTPIKFGLQFNITNSTRGNYSIYIEQEDQNEKREEIVEHANEASSRDIKRLKPCTSYKHMVELHVHNGSSIRCNHTENKETIKTNKLGE